MKKTIDADTIISGAKKRLRVAGLLEDDSAYSDKNEEVKRLKDELAKAYKKIELLQQKILTADDLKSDKEEEQFEHIFLTELKENYDSEEQIYTHITDMYSAKYINSIKDTNPRLTSTLCRILVELCGKFQKPVSVSAWKIYANTVTNDNHI